MRKLRVIILILSVAGMIAGAVYAVNDDNLSHAVLADDEVIERIEERTEKLDTNAYSLSVKYGDADLPFESDTLTYYLPVDTDKKEWEEIKLSALIRGEDKEDESDTSLLFEEDYEDHEKAEAVKSGHPFSFYAVNDEGYIKGNLVFTGLPLVSFDVTDETAEDGSSKFKMNVLDTDGSEISVKTSAKLHGNTSLNFEKKSLRLVLDKKENLLSLRKDDDWILNSLYADESRIRDQLCIELWNEVGAKVNPYGRAFGTDSKLTEIFINGHYQGIYALMVPIDAKQLGSDKVSENIEKNSDVVERIYKKKYTAEWNSEDFKGELPDPAMPDYRGGFYLKGDTVLSNEEEWESLYRIAALLENEDDTAFVSGIKEETDLENLVDNWLFYQAICGVDNENKNYYYITKDDGGKEKGYFIPWDMNLSFGDVYIENDYFSIFDEKALSEEVRWEPGQRLVDLGDAETDALLKSTWKKWRRGAFSDEAITEHIKKLESTVKDSGALAREMKRYPDGNVDTDFTHIYDFAIKRLAFVDEMVNAR